MAKKKFNSEERRAIIRKLKNIARERTDASWEKHRAAYKPSEVYLKESMLNNILTAFVITKSNISLKNI